MEYTPAQSTYEGSVSGRGRGSWSEIYERSWAKAALRVMNGVAHAAACSLLLSIMAEFLYRHKGREQRPPAIALTILVATDISLDIYSVARVKKKWQALALIARLILGLGYVAMFLVFVGFREVFPLGYAYWGITSEFSEPVVYLLLWGIGIWDLLHTSIHRHTLGRDLRTGTTGPTSRGVSQVPNAGSMSHMRGGLPQTPSQLERGMAPEANIALVEVHADEKQRPQSDSMSRSGSSSISGESSSQQSASAGTPESMTVSAESSRRTSTVLAEGTWESEGAREAAITRYESKP